MKRIARLFSFSFLMIPMLALAEASVVPNTLTRGPDELICIIKDVTNWAFTIFLAVAVMFVLLAAFKYLRSMGGEEVGAAHKMLIYAAIAIMVAVLSRGMVTVAQKIVGVEAQEACAGGSGGSSTTAPTGSNGNTTTGANGGAPGTAPLGFTRDDDHTRPFDAIVQKCSDGLTPGVVITYDINGDRDGRWSNFNTGTGNPNIPDKAKPDTVANAGNFGIVGSMSTGGFLGIASTVYDFRAETCNDGAIPIVLVDKSQKGSYERVTN